MSLADQFWMAAFVFIVVLVVAGRWIDHRRQESLREFEQKRKAHKEQVERSARKAL